MYIYDKRHLVCLWFCKEYAQKSDLYILWVLTRLSKPIDALTRGNEILIGPKLNL